MRSLLRLARLTAIALTGLGLAAGNAVAQAPDGVPRIGYLDGTGLSRWFEAFQRGLSDLGYVDSRNIIIERRSADGRSGRFPELAADLVRLRPQVIVASGSRPALAAKAATSTIPIVIAFATDPVGLGLVASVARPGGNVTGMSNLGADLMGKRLQLMAELVPGPSRAGVIWSPAVRDNQLDYDELRKAADTLGFVLESFEVARPEDYDGAFRDAKARVDFALVLSGPMAFANRDTIVAAAASHRVPAVYYDTEYAASGGLVSYGPSLVELHRAAAAFVDRILKGTKPADLPIQLPTRFEFAINLKAARALGLTVPPALLARADEIIE